MIQKNVYENYVIYAINKPYFDNQIRLYRDDRDMALITNDVRTRRDPVVDINRYDTYVEYAIIAAYNMKLSITLTSNFISFGPYRNPSVERLSLRHWLHLVFPEL